MKHNRLERHHADYQPERRGLCSLQDDMSVANGPGASVRADINNQLQSLATMNSGTAAPSTTYANQFWADTTNALAKKRNNANGSWVTFADLDFQHWLLSDGTVGAPAYSFSADPDSGLYRIGANNIGVAVNGAKVLDVATTGLGITGNLTVSGTTASGPLTLSTDTTNTIISRTSALVSGNRQHIQWKKSVATTAAVKVASIAGGADSGYSTIIHVKVYELGGTSGNYNISEGIATITGSGTANNISLAMTSLRSATLGLGTLAWSAGTGAADLNYTPNASADTSFIEVTCFARKVDLVTAY